MPDVSIATDVPEEAQLRSFKNATLQGNDRIAFSIAAHLSVPDEVYARGQAAVAAFVGGELGKASAAAPGLRFVVQIGTGTAPRDYDP